MKKEDKPASNYKDKHKEGRENQNIRDFNPSQFIVEDEVVKNKDEKEKAKKYSEKKSNEKKDE